MCRFVNIKYNLIEYENCLIQTNNVHLYRKRILFFRFKPAILRVLTNINYRNSSDRTKEESELRKTITGYDKFQILRKDSDFSKSSIHRKQRKPKSKSKSKIKSKSKSKSKFKTKSKSKFKSKSKAKIKTKSKTKLKKLKKTKRQKTKKSNNESRKNKFDSINSKSSKHMINKFQKMIFPNWKKPQVRMHSISDFQNPNFKRSLVSSKSKPYIQMESPIDTNYKRRSLRESQLLAFSQKHVELESEWSHFHNKALSGVQSKRKLNQSRMSHNKMKDSLNDSYGLKSTLKIKTKNQKKKQKEKQNKIDVDSAEIVLSHSQKRFQETDDEQISVLQV